MSECQRPPFGWYCTREVGHDGPCAATEMRLPPLVVTKRQFAEGYLKHEFIGRDEDGTPRTRTVQKAYRKLRDLDDETIVVLNPQEDR